MATAQKEPNSYESAMKMRLAALDGIFGERDKYLISPIPFYLDGDPTVVSYAGHLPGRIVYCTSEMTGGWGSGQKPGELGEYEFVMVLPEKSPLGPRPMADKVLSKGWVGVSLCGFCKYSLQTVLRHGDTSGPLPPVFVPHTHFLLVQLADRRVKFEFGGRRYGLMLMMSITEAECRFHGVHGSEALIKALRKAGVFPVTDPTRASVV